MDSMGLDPSKKGFWAWLSDKIDSLFDGQGEGMYGFPDTGEMVSAGVDNVISSAMGPWGEMIPEGRPLGNYLHTYDTASSAARAWGDIMMLTYGYGLAVDGLLVDGRPFTGGQIADPVVPVEGWMPSGRSSVTVDPPVLEPPVPSASTPPIPNGSQTCNSGQRVFTSPDAHIGPTATKLDAMFPGRVIDVNKKLPANVAGGEREVDILMDQFVIQVKKGRASGLASQVQETIATLIDQTRTVIGYAPDNYSGHAWTGAAEKGIPIARNFDELVEIIKELSKK